MGKKRELAERVYRKAVPQSFRCARSRTAVVLCGYFLWRAHKHPEPYVPYSPIACVKSSAALIEFRRPRRALGRLPKEFGLESNCHRCNVSSIAAVCDSMTPSTIFSPLGVKPFVVTFFRAVFRWIKSLVSSASADSENRNVKTQRLLHLPAQLIERSRMVEVTARTVHACQSVFIGPFHAGPGRETFSSREAWERPGRPSVRRRLSEPRGLVCRRIGTITPLAGSAVLVLIPQGPRPWSWP